MGMFGDFRKFALRGNLIDMAVGFTVGAAFTTIAKSLVDDIIMPPIGYLIGGIDFSKLQFELKPITPPAIVKDAIDTVTPTVAAAAPVVADAKVAAIRYGNFINNLIAFFMITLAMFIVVRMMNKFEATLEAKFGTPPPPGEPTEKKCEFCRTTIPYQASRCPHCTSQLGQG